MTDELPSDGVPKPDEWKVQKNFLKTARRKKRSGGTKAQPTSKFGAAKRGTKSNPQCLQCGKKGHYSSMCPALADELLSAIRRTANIQQISSFLKENSSAKVVGMDGKPRRTLKRRSRGVPWHTTSKAQKSRHDNGKKPNARNRKKNAQRKAKAKKTCYESKCASWSDKRRIQKDEALWLGMDTQTLRAVRWQTQQAKMEDLRSSRVRSPFFSMPRLRTILGRPRLRREVASSRCLALAGTLLRSLSCVVRASHWTFFELLRFSSTTGTGFQKPGFREAKHTMWEQMQDLCIRSTTCCSSMKNAVLWPFNILPTSEARLICITIAGIF